jgi:replicative DNA helicase
MANAESLFLSALLRSRDAGAINRHDITPQLFHAHHDAYLWLYRYWARYRRLPSKAVFKQRYPEISLYAIDDVDATAEELKQAFAKRTMTDLLDQSVGFLLNGQIAQAMDLIRRETMRVQTVMTEVADDADVAESWQGVYDEVMHRVEMVRQRGSAGIPTGFTTLDLVTGGIQPGWFTVVDARLGNGKTWTMLKMAVTAALSGFTALYYTLEQPPNQIMMRSHSLLSKAFSHKEIFDNMNLQRGTGFDMLEYKRFLESLESKLLGRLIVSGAIRERVTPMTVAAGIDRQEPDIVFVDYITLMRMGGDGGWQSVANLSADLQQVTQQSLVPIVIGSQKNRQGELARSDSIGWDVDLRLELQQKSKSVIKMAITKFRHGVGGDSWWTRFQPGKGHFEECSGDDAADLMEQDALGN